VVETHLLSKPNGRKYFRVITKDDEGKQVYVPHANILAKLSPVDSAKGTLTKAFDLLAPINLS
jgi:hypothetical protein